MKIETLCKVAGGALLLGGYSSAALFAQATAPPPGAAGGRGPRVAPAAAWAPKPIKANGWVAPNKPVWRLSEVLAAHKGQVNWTETIVSDDYLHADYISMGPGEKTPRRFNPDTREWWVVEDGQIRFSIEGQEPFVAGKGYMVQVPYRNVYSMETVGDKPSLRFEVNIANVKKEYPIDEKPPVIPGMEFIKVTVAGKGKYENGNKPYLDFNEIVKGNVKTNNFVKDDRGVVNIIRGMGVEDPGPATKGHFHEECSEFWFIMEGKVRYALETQPTIIAEQGDVVYAPKQMWHLASLAGDGMSTRLPMNGYVDIGHNYLAQDAIH